MNEAVGLLETVGLSATLAAIDAMEKAANVRVLQCELNDFYGVSTKIAGKTSDVSIAVEAGRRVAERMGGAAGRRRHPPLRSAGSGRDHRAARIQPADRTRGRLLSRLSTDARQKKGRTMSQEYISALGLIETQGFTAVFEAIDTACKAANVEVVGREKLGGGYITVIIRGDVAAVNAAVEAGKLKVADLGKLIAAHVIARPSPMVLGLLPKPA